MRPAIREGAFVLGVLGMLLCVPLVDSAQAASPGGIAPQCVGVFKAAHATHATAPAVPQVQRDERTDTTFFFTAENDGAVRIRIAAANVLQVEKVVYPDGHFTIVLQAGSDRVSVGVSEGVLDVERGRRSLRLALSKPANDDWMRLRTMLVGSRALDLFRALALELDEALASTPGGAAVALSDAVLGYLDGDVGAVDRLDRRYRRAARARIQVAASFLVRQNGCWDRYQEMVVAAADDYSSCRRTFSWYNPRQAECVFVWSLQAESAWFQFLGCSSIPVK